MLRYRAPNLPVTLEDISKSLESYTIEIRRSLHKIPEPSWGEEKTLAFIKNEITQISKKSLYQTELNEKRGGIWVDFYVNLNLPWILFRSDIDGLPIREQTGLPYSSQHEGYMHACGHDCHAAMLLGAFNAITSGLISPLYNIRFVWQRAEECGENPSGGSLLVSEGVLENINFAYALHIASTLESGVFYSRPDLMMANSCYFDFEITCSGGHVMRPDLGTNAISLMNDILTHLKGFEKLYFGPNEEVLFVPSIAKAGNKSNIRPSSATFCFALRNFLTIEKRAAFIHALKEKLIGITNLYPTAELSSFRFNPGYPALYNDRDNYLKVANALAEEYQKAKLLSPMFSGEDFAYYLNEVPGSFWCLGASTNPIHDHHTPHFNPDESALYKGVLFWLTLARISHKY